MRVQPKALIGVGIWLIYVVVVIGIQKASGIPYTEFGDSTANMWRSTIPSLAVGSVIIAVIGAWLGWWGPAMRDQHRTKVGWALIAPALFLVMAVGNFAATDWGNVAGGFLLVALVLGVLVGFAEEFLCRGLLLVGLRGTFHEVAVWALTCLMFGLMHGVNIVLGQAVGPTVMQIAMAALQGSGFYILRRHFGTLVWAMALHGLWDMSIFVQASSGSAASLLTLLSWPTMIVALAGGFVVARRTQKGQVEDYAIDASALAPATA